MPARPTIPGALSATPTASFDAEATRLKPAGAAPLGSGLPLSMTVSSLERIVTHLVRFRQETVFEQFVTVKQLKNTLTGNFLKNFEICKRNFDWTGTRTLDFLIN